MKILWLASWYPNKLAPFNGDFIKRHAESVSLFEQLEVIYVVKDEEGTLTKNILIENQLHTNLSETIIYYYVPKNTLKVVHKFLSELRYQKIYKTAIKQYLQRNGNPDIVHVHVGMRAGLVARWLKIKTGTPFVVSEHWSGFLKEANEKFEHIPIYMRAAWKKVMKNAEGCSAVSKYLADGLKQHFNKTICRVIPNVVDTKIFYPNHQLSATLKFIHISGLHPLKNPKDILRAFKIVRNKYPDAELQIFGSTNEEIIAFTNSLQLQESVQFTGEVSQQILAKHLNEAHALILYSSYETFGCVIIEANACGVPVIVSDIPVFHETVQEGINGYFALPLSPESLASRMIDVVNNQPFLDRLSISKNTTTKYSYPIVGKQFTDWYREILKIKNDVV